MGTSVTKEGNAVTALLNGEIDYLIHCCNCQRSMGSGIALEIKNRVPLAYAAYMNDTQILGNYSIGGNVVNIYAQEYYGTYGPFYAKNGRQISYVALNRALRAMRAELGADKIYGLPVRFGSDRAGGDWDIIKQMVEDVLPKVIWYELK